MEQLSQLLFRFIGNIRKPDCPDSLGCQVVHQYIVDFIPFPADTSDFGQGRLNLAGWAHSGLILPAAVIQQFLVVQAADPYHEELIQVRLEN